MHEAKLIGLIVDTNVMFPKPNEYDEIKKTDVSKRVQEQTNQYHS